MTLPNGTVIKYVYNGLGQKVQEIEDQGGLNLTTNFTYDANGNLKTVTDANNTTTTYSYDALNQLKTVEDPLIQTTQYTYDQSGNLRFLTDAKTQTTGFVYNALGRLTQETRPMGQSTSYMYNGAGQLSEKTDAKGQTTTYTYNDAHQLTQLNDAGGNTVTFTYDRTGTLSGYDDGTTSASYTYDDFGHKLSETVNYGPFSKTFSYTYYANGQKQSFSMPDGTTYSYTYNDNNDVQNIRIPGVGNISYPSYTLSRPDSVSFPGGSQSYDYDALLRLDNIDSQHLDYDYSYDTVSNILTKSTARGTYGYDYDDLYRLADVNNPTLDDEAYNYDPVGNRLTASGVSGTIEHNANNELRLYGDVTYDYDANGNMVSKTSTTETRQYVYNTQNRLVRVEDGSGGIIAEYDYDPFGRRLWKEVDGTRTYFFYANEGLVAEYDEDGQELRSYGYTPDSTWTTNPLWLKEGRDYYWYQNDHVGTPQTLIDSNSNIVWEAHYTAFGDAQISIETITNYLRFPGQYFDEETGLHYNWFRYYDPEIGRYITPDPIGFVGGDANVYAYCFNDSIHCYDSQGLRSGEAIVFHRTTNPGWAYHIGYDVGYGKIVMLYGGSIVTIDLQEFLTLRPNYDILGYGNLVDYIGPKEFQENIEKAKTALENAFRGYDPSGTVCIDVVNEGIGENYPRFKRDIESDYYKRPENQPDYRKFILQNTPKDPYFFRRNTTLVEFFKHTDRWREPSPEDYHPSPPSIKEQLIQFFEHLL